MTKELISLGLLEELIKDFESMLAKYNMLEQDIILQQLRARFNKKQRELMTSDLMGQMPLGGLFGRIKKGFGGEKNETIG